MDYNQICEDDYCAFHELANAYYREGEDANTPQDIIDSFVRLMFDKVINKEINAVNNVNVSANMMRSVFYVCPICGNIFHGMGAAVVQCHGIVLAPCQAEESDENHMIFIKYCTDGKTLSRGKCRG